MKKFSGIIIFLLFFIIPSYAEPLNLFCLIDTLQLKKAKLDEKEYNRFAGKVIKFKINFKENLIYDISEDSQMSVISGINLGVINFKKTLKGLNYTNEQNIRGDNGKNIKYIYNNDISISEDNKKGRLISRIKQSGISLNSFDFSIPCRWYDYTDAEILLASRGLINNKKILEISEEDKNKMAEGRKKVWGSSNDSKNETENETKITKKTIINLQDYKANGLNSLLNSYLENFESDDLESLLYLYKAKFFENNINNFVLLKKNYLDFKKGEKLKFEDTKNLSDQHFFGLPLNKVDKDRLKRIKKEYKEKIKKLKNIS